MNRRLLFLFLSCLYGQTVEFPYEWSGQFGRTSINGTMFWNTDWTSGPLLFDGTYTHYPSRYGQDISAYFQLTNTQQILISLNEIPDTTSITTTLDYERGDYNYDLLAIDLDFESPDRYVGLHGFKRSYAGRAGQFFHPNGSASPMQQTYRVDYRSENKGWLIDASAARLVTESGLPDSGAVNGLLKDEILSAGIITQSPDEKLQWTSHLALFQQWRKVDASWYSNKRNQYINRTRWHNQLSGVSIGKLKPLLGLEMNFQSISKNDTTKRDINWHTLYLKIDLWGFNSAVGLMLIDNKVADYLSINYLKSFGKFEISGMFEESSKPYHFNLIMNGNEVVNNRISHLNIKKVFGGIVIGLTADYCSMMYDERNYYTFQSGFLVKSNLFKHVSFSSSYYFREGQTLLFDGINNVAKFDFQYNNENILNRFALHMSLSGEGLLNREETIRFDPINSFPYEYLESSPNEPEDIWLLNSKIAITISSMTLTWSISNILQAIEPFALKIFPEKKAGDFLIQHNPMFPPMGRLVMFGIHWTFKD